MTKRSKQRASAGPEVPLITVVTINGKQADLARVPHLLVPFRQWTIGHLKGLERAGLSIVGQNPGALSLEELVALVTYVTSQANPQITGADVDTLDSAAFGQVFRPIMDKVSPPAATDESTTTTGEGGKPAYPFPGSSDA